MKTLMRNVLFMLAVVFFPLFLKAGEAMQQLEKTVTEIMDLLENPVLKGEDKKTERDNKLGDLLESRFNYEEMSRKTLAKEWKNLQEDKQKEFTNVFKELLKRTYISRIEAYTNEKVTYSKEISLDEGKAVVQTVLVSEKGDIPIDYNMHLVGEEWKIYDVTIEGVGLLKNYRNQFREIMEKGSFDDLMNKLKEKNEKLET
ncbi:MAG: ABC transporter substrate-binding protein [Candidatus Aureabacteria bacterium]|nr:ABC transporter substrate-binding protein [Candidatus Auribacterota bacterium]